MCPDGPERKLAAILSADVVGYSRLMAEDEAGTIRTLTSYRDEIALLIQQHRGRVVDATGDNLLAEFPTALDAVQCALAVQRVLTARNTGLPEDHRMQFRIGVHMGDVAVDGNRLYGDGVNIAARLEALAEPGGICISATVHEQVERKLDGTFEDLGDQSLKNIPRPIRAYRLRSTTTDLDLPGMAEQPVPGFHGAPAIAVLPFDNLSGDPEQEYFADGLVEDLITGLSAWRELPVIARNSSFTYKGRAVDVKQVSRELGVRYVVEGSVRRSGGRVRISAQLIDASSGAHVWAERYDRELGDIFDVQDEIVESVVGALVPALFESDRERVVRQAPRSFDAWDCLQRGWAQVFSADPDANAQARQLFERAAELDPRLSNAYCGIAATHWNEFTHGWSDSPEHCLAQMQAAAKRAVELDDQSPGSHLWLGRAYIRELEKGIAEFALATRLGPSEAFAHASLGMALAIVGRPDEAIRSIEKAIRLSPKDPMTFLYLSYLALAHFAAGRYGDALEWARRSLERNPSFAHAHFYLVASYAQLGRIDEARREAEDLRRLGRSPAGAFSLSDTEVSRRLIDGLRKAGVTQG